MPGLPPLPEGAAEMARAVTEALLIDGMARGGVHAASPGLVEAGVDAEWRGNLHLSVMVVQAVLARLDALGRAAVEADLAAARSVLEAEWAERYRDF